MAKKSEQGEVLGEQPVTRLEGSVTAALRRKPAQEAKLAGALRVLAAYSPRLRRAALDAVSTLAKRGSFQRPLYSGGVRAVAELDGREAAAVIKRALTADDSGGLSTLSASCFIKDASIDGPLARVAGSRHPHLAFAAEVARIARGESGGEHVASIAPKIKESHRIALCVEIFVPLLRRASLPIEVAPALAVLRDAERHLGRWLVFGEMATRAGDAKPLAEARHRAATGPSSARAAWSFVAWALGDGAEHPSARPTVELVSRLSDRPSADRDPTFLYRLAEAGVPASRPMLENFAKGSSLKDETAVRAAMYLARDHGRDDLRKSLYDLATSTRHEAYRGVATAALFELGDRETAFGLADELSASRHLATMAWGALLKAASVGKMARVITEPAFRRVQLGWVE